MARVKRGKALVASLRAQAGVRDPEALAAYLGRFKKARKAGRSVAEAAKAAKGDSPNGSSNGRPKTRAEVKDLARRKGQEAKAAQEASKPTPQEAVTRTPERSIPPSVLKQMTDAQLQSRNRRLLAQKDDYDPRAIDRARDEVYKELNRRGKLSPGFYEKWQEQLARKRRKATA